MSRIILAQVEMSLVSVRNAIAIGSGISVFSVARYLARQVAAEVASAVVLRAGASVPWSLVQVVPQVSYFSYYLISAYLIFELRAELID